MVIDFHVHAFPDKIAKRALETLSTNAGGFIPFHEGNVESLTSALKKFGVDKGVLLNIATNPKQQTAVNDFAINMNSENLISFGSVHPEAENALDELERIARAGLKGVKLHPDYQKFFVDEERMFPIYEKIAELGLITVFHAGVDIGYFDPVHCTPERLAKALSYFNGAKVVAAHMGGWSMWNEVEKHLVGKDIFFDTAYSYGRMPIGHFKRIVESHGADKILFGSDMPWSSSEDETKFVKLSGIDEKSIKMILGENAKKLLAI